MKFNFIIIFLILLSSPVAFAKKQVVDSDQETNQIRQPYKEADNGIDMRKSRRLGIGLQAAGALGFGGATPLSDRRSFSRPDASACTRASSSW